MSTIQSVSLYYQDPSSNSDKEYHIQLVDVGNGKYVVNFQYGRRGSALQTGTKTPSPVGMATAGAIYNKLEREKKGKGYEESGKTKAPINPNIQPKNTPSPYLPQLLNNIEKEEVDEYINDDDYLAQEKMDGERRMVVSDSNLKIYGINKKGNKTDLPDDVKDSINIPCVLDGEIIGDVVYVFDALSMDGKDMKGEKCIDRINSLNILSFGDGVKIVKTAFTQKEKQNLFDSLKRRNAEGIVFKKKNSFYTPGRPNSGGNQLKFKFNKTATFVVESITPNKRSVELIVYASPTKSTMTVEVGKVTIPPNYDIPKIGDFVEVRYLYAYKGGGLAQPVYLGVRTDCDKTDAGIGQLIFKEGQ